jgi:DNA-binding LytR/AlgR family response regulator
MVMDDEPLAREVIIRYIGRVTSLQLVAECGNALQALTLLQQQQIDLIFADIQMPELLGTELIKILHHPPKVIITSAFSEYAMEGFELNVVDFLLKPIQFERFLKAVYKVFKEAGMHTQEQLPVQDKQDAAKGAYLYFRTDRKMVKVMLDEIVFIEGMKNYIKIKTSNGWVVTKHSMNAVEAMLSEALFIRVHRSFIVSKAKIKSITGELIEIGDMEIPVGKLYKHNVMKMLGA